MKKIITLLFVVVCFSVKAQFVNQLVFIDSFSASQVDSVLIVATGSQIIPFHLNYAVKIYKVIYNTVDWDSNAITASGLLCVPQNTPCTVPLISYQHGTTTKKSDVPSRLAGEWYIGLAAASIGYLTILPDYLGLGDGPGLHPYQHAHTEATAVIDMIRASKELSDSLGAPLNDQLFLFGYSQGGHATMAAHQLIQEKLDNVMHVTASAPMSGAYDMSGVMANVMTSDSTYPSPYYLPYLIFGYNEVYHLFAEDSDVLIYPYDSILPPLFDGNHSGGQVDNKMPAVPKLIMQQVQLDSFINDSVNNYFRVKLRENNTYNWIPNSPVRMYFCRGDHNVPFQNAIVAYEKFRQSGALLVDTFDVSGTLDHVPCAQFAILFGTGWFDSLIYQPLISNGIVAVNDSNIVSANGSLTEIPGQGEPPYTYLWSNGDTTATTSNLSAGKYYVTVTDKNVCQSYVDSATVRFVTGLQDQVLTNVKVYPNPSKGVVTIQNLDPTDNIKQPEVFDMTGRSVKTWSSSQGNNLQLYFDESAQGIYFLRLRSEKGKTAEIKLSVL
ncbi:MAG: C-terminal target protein [Bacteroidota bacterium]|nr:C-terminal target protein [Bacteroidota bacterium]